MSLERSATIAARAVHQRVRLQLDQQPGGVELAVVRRANPLQAELTSGPLTLDLGEEFELAANVRQWIADNGIKKGDMLAVAELGQSRWIAIGVLTDLDPGPSGGGSDIEWNVTPVGAVNGSNTTFVTPHIYVPGSLAVYLNGLLQRTPTDWSPAAADSFTFATAPTAGDVVRVTYERAS